MSSTGDEDIPVLSALLMDKIAASPLEMWWIVSLKRSPRDKESINLAYNFEPDWGRILNHILRAPSTSSIPKGSGRWCEGT